MASREGRPYRGASQPVRATDHEGTNKMKPRGPYIIVCMAFPVAASICGA
jgi:hypothetical protein